MKKHMSQEVHVPRESSNWRDRGGNSTKRNGSISTCTNGECRKTFMYIKFSLFSKYYKYRNWCPECRTVIKLTDLCD